MSKTAGNTFSCRDCHGKVEQGSDFCPHCGSMFVSELQCTNHGDNLAAGVCVICCVPYCKHCGKRVNKIFLCGRHEQYEIYEGMARVLGISDEVMAQYAQRCLEQAGLYAIIYSRKAGPISVGGPDYTLFNASGEFDGHIINEVKVMVPSQEVLEAERILKKLDLKKK